MECGISRIGTTRTLTSLAYGGRVLTWAPIVRPRAIPLAQNSKKGGAVGPTLKNGQEPFAQSKKGFAEFLSVGVRYSPYQHYSSFNFISVGWACSYLGPYSPPKGISPEPKIEKGGAVGPKHKNGQQPRAQSLKASRNV